MTVLIDTSVFLWCIVGQQANLSAKARRLISEPATRLALSVASLWEIALKVRAGKLKIPERADFFQAHIARLGVAVVLPVEARHVLALFDLPSHHRDPFDRILIAQAKLEKLPFVTGDKAIRRYAIETIW